MYINTYQREYIQMNLKNFSTQLMRWYGQRGDTEVYIQVVVDISIDDSHIQIYFCIDKLCAARRPIVVDERKEKK